MSSLCSGVREEPGRIYYTLSEKQSERQFLKRSSVRVLLVEKTDRLYRNLKDYVTVDELDLEIHFVKENVVVSQDSRSSEKFMHGIKVLMAKNFIDNLSEETKRECSNSIWKGNTLTATLRQPFDLLAITNTTWQRKKAAGADTSDLRPIWLRR